jgi:hypothetical protein
VFRFLNLNDTGGNMPSDNESNANLFSEWTTSRDMLTEYDGFLNDLRKYGFSFLTALLAAESVLVPTVLSKSGVAEGTVLPNSVKVAVLGINLLLIILLRLLDRNYQVFQDAAATRALVLERTLNLELTEIITLRYKGCHLRRSITGLYVAFVAGVYGLGWAVLWPDWGYIAVLSGFSILAFIFIEIIIGKRISVEYPLGELDWSINKLDCCSGEEIEITLTNLFEKPIQFEKDCFMWELRKENSDTTASTIDGRKLNQSVTINKDDGFSWSLKTEEIDEGIYQFWRCVLRPLPNKRPFRFSREDYAISRYGLTTTKNKTYNLLAENEKGYEKDYTYLVKPIMLKQLPLSRKLTIRAAESENISIKKVILSKNQKNNDTINLSIENIGSSTVTIDSVRVNGIEETIQDEKLIIKAGGIGNVIVKLWPGHELKAGNPYKIELKSTKSSKFNFESKA